MKGKNFALEKGKKKQFSSYFIFLFFFFTIFPALSLSRRFISFFIPLHFPSLPFPSFLASHFSGFETLIVVLFLENNNNKKKELNSAPEMFPSKLKKILTGFKIVRSFFRQDFSSRMLRTKRQNFLVSSPSSLFLTSHSTEKVFSGFQKFNGLTYCQCLGSLISYTFFFFVLFTLQIL